MHTGALGIQANDNSNNSNRRFKKNAVRSPGVLGVLKAEVRLKTLSILREGELEINTYVIPPSPALMRSRRMMAQHFGFVWFPH